MPVLPNSTHVLRGKGVFILILVQASGCGVRGRVLRRYDADWTPTCRRLPSALTFGRDRSRVRNNHALQSNPRTPHAPLSARIALDLEMERVVIANSQMVATQSQAT